MSALFAVGLHMNRSEVGRVTPCAPSFVLRESVVGGVDARKRALHQCAADVSSAEPSLCCRQDVGSTLRFVESLHDFMNLNQYYEPGE